MMTVSTIQRNTVKLSRIRGSEIVHPSHELCSVFVWIHCAVAARKSSEFEMDVAPCANEALTRKESFLNTKTANRLYIPQTLQKRKLYRHKSSRALATGRTNHSCLIAPAAPVPIPLGTVAPQTSSTLGSSTATSTAVLCPPVKLSTSSHLPCG